VSGVPGVLGCIDGSYISIKTPVNKIRSVYSNRHDMIAMTLQAICDSDKRFLDIFVGCSGKIHDARVFKLSPIFNEVSISCLKISQKCSDFAQQITTDSLVKILLFLKLGSIMAPSFQYS
jgi:hypothetical protein